MADELHTKITSEVVSCGEDCMFVALFLGDSLIGIFLVDDPGTEDGCSIDGPEGTA